MKVDLKDITFVVLVRIDSVERLENIFLGIKSLNKFFKTNIIVCESASYNNKILESLLKGKCRYIFNKDNDVILYKTRIINSITRYIDTDMICLLDADIVIDKKNIIHAVNLIRNGDFDVVYPYNGVCYNVSNIIRKVYIENQNVNFLYRNIGKMCLLYQYAVYGGIVLVKNNIYSNIGRENTNHYGWGNDDVDRYSRFLNNGYRIKRLDMPLFHLEHPRNVNSKFLSDSYEEISGQELLLTKQKK